MPNQRSFLSLKIMLMSSSTSFASSSLDLTVATSSRLILQICQIMAQSMRSKRCRFVLVSGQVSLAWIMEFRTQELYTWPRVLYERWQDVRTGSSSMNFFQAVVTQVVTSVSQPRPAESMSPSYPLQLIRYDLDFTLWSAVNKANISHAQLQSGFGYSRFSLLYFVCTQSLQPLQ